MSPKAPRVWLVTGCSQGFGRIFAQEISSRGDKVIATARNKSTILDLEQLPGVKTMQLDVTCTREELDTKVQEALEVFGGIDVLVNNAGYVLSGVWEELS
jgi:NADP-dependent 3-hydroxy acid dehydrogenase YdfG